jgi:hypothetical protein
MRALLLALPATAQTERRYDSFGRYTGRAEHSRRNSCCGARQPGAATRPPRGRASIRQLEDISLVSPVRLFCS